MDSADGRGDAGSRSVLLGIRLAVGIGQGCVLYMLWYTTGPTAWWHLDPLAYAALHLLALLLPVALIEGLGSIRPRTLLVYLAVAAVVITLMAIHQAGNAISQPVNALPGMFGWFAVVAASEHFIASASAVAGCLYVAHALVSVGDAEHRPIGRYSAYFDVSWKYWVQLFLTSLFVALLWGVLWLGATLFQIVKLEFLHHLVTYRWFFYGVTCAAIAVALHLTDVHPGVVRGFRTVQHLVMSWLLPVMTVIAVGFLIALPFAGIDALWSSKRGATVLLGVALVLIVLINAAYRPADDDPPPHPAIRHSARIASVALVPLIALAAWALLLRVHQDGWSPRRILLLVYVGFGVIYAVGYAIAAVASRPWMRPLEITNILSAFALIVVTIALGTSVADPARLATVNQVWRLETGRVSAEKFDFTALRFDDGKYGMEALERLRASANGPDAPIVIAQVDAALHMTNRFAALLAKSAATKAAGQAAPASSADIVANIAVHPDGAKLPDGFLGQDWGHYLWSNPFMVPGCLRQANAPCDAVLLGSKDSATQDVLVFTTKMPFVGAVMRSDPATGKWAPLGGVSNIFCPGIASALEAGNFKMVPPQMDDLDVNGTRLRLTLASVGCK